MARALTAVVMCCTIFAIWSTILRSIFTSDLKLLSQGKRSDGGLLDGWRMESVALNVIDSQHYQLWSPEGNEEWENLLPFGRHTIEIIPETEEHEILNNDTFKHIPTTYTVSLFHQLKCVDIIRQAYASLRFERQNAQTSYHTSASKNELVKHCINYLRQTFLCHSQIQLEPHTRTVEQNGYDTLCFDWEAIYAKFEQRTSYTGRF